MFGKRSRSKSPAAGPDDDAGERPSKRPSRPMPLISTSAPEPDDHDGLSPAVAATAAALRRAERHSRPTLLISTSGPVPDDREEAPPAPAVPAPPRRPPSLAARLFFFPFELIGLLCRLPGLIVWVMMPSMAVTIGLVPCNHGPVVDPQPDVMAPCRAASHYRNPWLFRLFCRRLHFAPDANGRTLCLCMVSGVPVFRPTLWAVLSLIVVVIGATGGLAWGVVRLVQIQVAQASAPTPAAVVPRTPAKPQLSTQQRAAAFAASAREHKDANAYASARIQFKNAVALTPDDPKLQFELGDSAAKCGKADEARLAFAEALRLDPTFAEAHRQLALLAADAKDYATAIMHASKLCALLWQDSTAFLLLGKCQLETQEFAKAEKSLASALALDPNCVDALIVLGALESRRGSPQAAEPHYRRALELQPDSIAAQIGLANALVATRDYAQAVERLEGWVAKYPDKKDLVPILCGVQAKAGNLATAAGLYRKHAGIGPLSPYARQELIRGILLVGERLATERDADEAVAFYRDVIKLQPELFDVRRRLVGLLAARGKMNDAYELAVELGRLQQDPVGAALLQAELSAAQGLTTLANQQCAAALAAGSSDPRNVLVHKLRAKTAILGNDLPAAQKELDEYLKTMPDDMQAVSWLAACHREQGRKPEAVSLLRAAGERCPTESLPLLLLAEWALADGQRDESIQSLRSALQRTPGNLPALCAMAMLLAERKESIEEAQALAEKARAQSADSPEATHALGWVLVQRGQTERALELLATAAAKRPADPTVRYHLARALRATGRNEEAARHLQAALASRAAFRERADAAALAKEIAPAAGTPPK